MENSSPVCSAIKEIRDLFDVSNKKAVYSYKSDEDFKLLWQLLKPTLEIDELSKTFIIVWDSTPPRSGAYKEINVDKYLTPFDWAVGLTLSIYNATQKNTESVSWPDLRIFIIDLNAGLYSDSVKFLDQFPKRTMKNLPWVRIFSPGNSDLYWTIEDFFSDFIDVHADPVPSMANFNEQNIDLDILKNLWASFLTRPSASADRHAIANLVGPLLLTKGSNSDIHINALSCLMRSVGLLPESENEDALLALDKPPWIDWNDTFWKTSLADLKKGGKKLNILLIDDQHKQGWGRILCMALGIGYNAESKNDIISVDNDNIVIKAYESAEALRNKLTLIDQRFQFSLGGDKETPEILFLDLRLFPGDFVNELVFFKKLLEHAEIYIKAQADNLPWKGSLQEDIKTVNVWLAKDNKKPDDDGYIRALTFLPRILSLNDFSFPIILFSSTGRGDIAEMLKPYGNIITVFDKPKFTVDVPSDIAEQTKGKFKAVLKKAIKILKVRRQCIEIEKYKTVSPANALSASSVHVELLIDESFSRNRNRVYVGGCFAVFTDKISEAVQKKADDFDEDLFSNGVRYFHPLVDTRDHALKVLPKKTNVSQELSEALKSANRPDHLNAIRLSYMFMGTEACFDLLDPREADNLYRQTLTSLIELFLFETLPALLGESVAEKASVSIFAATRVKEFIDDQDGRAAISRAEYHFGMSSQLTKSDAGLKHLLFSISRESIYPIVADVLSFHGSKRRNIHRVAGIKLAYHSAKDLITKFPEYFLCRTCKKIFFLKSNLKTNNNKNVNIIKAPNITEDKLAKFDYFIPDNKGGFIRPLADNNYHQYYVPPSECQTIANAEKGDLLIFDGIKTPNKSGQSPPAYGVRLLTENDYKYSLSDVKLICNCSNADNIFPDYRALHYIADELLSNFKHDQNNNIYGNINLPESSFDDEVNDALNLMIAASRAMDREDIVNAIVQIQASDGATIGDHGAKKLILRRIASKMEHLLKGGEFMQIVEKLNISEHYS
ncbi:MAG: hypothetical protein Q7J31_04470 [Syntrophales bacterium]|nr:hypothetical protein [Syntrophales bacterium]